MYFLEREREREVFQVERSWRSKADSALSVEPNLGLYLTTLRSGPQPKPGVWRLTDYATQAHWSFCFWKTLYLPLLCFLFIFLHLNYLRLSFYTLFPFNIPSLVLGFSTFSFFTCSLTDFTQTYRCICQNNILPPELYAWTFHRS